MSACTRDAKRKEIISKALKAGIWIQPRHPTVHQFSNWPRGGTNEKTPTLVLLSTGCFRVTADGPVGFSILRYNEGDPTRYLWGAEIQDDDTRYEWFKLDLESPQRSVEKSNLAAVYPSGVAMPRGYIPPEKLTVDYLKALREHAVKQLQDTLTRNNILINLSSSIDYVVTIPAIWSAKAKDLTRSCASQAGMGDPDDIKVITEPEAAAMFELKERPPDDLQIGDTFVLCDAGGGTVDLISYTIKAMNPLPVVEEAVSGSGGRCGSSILNRIFSQWLRNKLSDEPEWEEEVLSVALDEFEKMKKTFNPTKYPNYAIRLPKFWSKPRKNINRGNLNLSVRDIELIFKPVVKEIRSLVMDQINRAKQRPKSVILVGGFGQSDYLMLYLQKAVGRDIKVTKGVNPVVAVVKGAVLYGLSNVRPRAHVRVDSRKARMNWGTEAMERFDPVIHDVRRRVVDQFSGGPMVPTMQWFMRKEDKVEDRAPKALHFYYEREVAHGAPKEIKMTIYTSESTPAPRYSDPTVTEFAKLKADLSGLDESDLFREQGADNQLYYKLDFDIEMKCHSASISYTLLYKEKRYHKLVQADYV
ncbi:hypothetical protein SLS56_011655 [Neofusicoccum ribis]|uniref:Actin-like ATPase domain-containing protein n=1 Tax=Neofusicoccum ribis TaxID=45134 RepID=A0ABR3SB29_9PEZI